MSERKPNIRLLLRPALIVLPFIFGALFQHFTHCTWRTPGDINISLWYIRGALMVMFYFVLLKIDFRKLAPRPSHFAILAANIAMGLIPYFIFNALGYRNLALAAFFVGITPTANAAAVVMDFLEGKVEYVMTGFVITNVAIDLALIGLIPLVMISPADQDLIEDGSDERRRFMDVVISQLDRKYLDCLTTYNALLKQRNALLKQLADKFPSPSMGEQEGAALLEVLEWQMVEPAQYIFRARTEFFEAFKPHFEKVYRRIAGEEEIPVLRYVSQLQDRDLREAYVRTRQRDLILGWTSQGIHKDDLEMKLGEFPLKQVGSQGQQRTFVLAMKLAQALYLGNKPTSDNVLRTATGSPIEQSSSPVKGGAFSLSTFYFRLSTKNL